MKASTHEAQVLREAARTVELSADYDDLVRLAANSRFVLIGEASHGTEEFYAVRADLTRRLIADHGFRGVAAEADWPDMLRVQRYVSHREPEPDVQTALGDFQRFPAWMWRNTVMVDFIQWLRDWNTGKEPG